MENNEIFMGSDNPFMDSYVKKEIGWYGDMPTKVKLSDGLKLVMEEPHGRLDDYLNVNFRVGLPAKVPTLYIDNILWMSLTPMEIQSQYLAILNSYGNVGVAGLGLGYSALKMAKKDSVSSVTVFENDRRVIDMFNASFKRKKGFKKINIVEGDARKLIPDRIFDYLYVDIYESMCPDEIVEDINIFKRCVDDFPNTYAFWGKERIFIDAYLGFELIDIDVLSWQIQCYINTWHTTPLPKTYCKNNRTMSSLYKPMLSEDYICDVLEALEMEI